MINNTTYSYRLPCIRVTSYLFIFLINPWEMWIKQVVIFWWAGTKIEVFYLYDTESSVQILCSVIQTSLLAIKSRWSFVSFGAHFTLKDKISVINRCLICQYQNKMETKQFKLCLQKSYFPDFIKKNKEK